MKKLKTTIEVRCYSEEEAKDFLEDFRQGAKQEGYCRSEWIHIQIKKIKRRNC